MTKPVTVDKLLCTPVAPRVVMEVLGHDGGQLDGQTPVVGAHSP
jgi:hypothetical protein